MAYKKEEKIDYLQVDRPIPGQNYVCLTFISPENILKKKEMYYLHNFLKENASEYGLDSSDIIEKYEDWMYNRKNKLNEIFDKENDFQTSSRGIKIRGVYTTLQEAQIRAKILQKLDDTFHVFVGQVGYWLPWDPEADKVEGQEYADEELNKLMKKYMENKVNRDVHFEQMKKEKRERILKEQMEAAKETPVEQEQQEQQEDDLEASISKDDPWIQRKETNGDNVKTI